jgi:ribosomal protein S18 acetylase RimI-like enzyme
VIAHDPARARALILEYARDTGVDLSFQHFQEEIASLETFYEAVLVADDDAGCVALRRIDEGTCEMKRLYVRPAFRGRGVGVALINAVIARARERGYARMRLDTLPQMTEAIALYHRFGFVEIAPYRFNPIEGTRYMELAL